MRVPKQRALVDRRALAAAIDAVKVGARPAVLGLVRGALEKGQSEVERRLMAGASGSEVVAARSFLIDQILRVLFDRAALSVYPQSNPTKADRLSLIAIGGYGRGELAPHSDIDLLFLHPYKLTARGEQIVEYVLYMLWDLGLRVGHATRSENDCLRRARDDMTIRTSILEARYVWGDQALARALRHRFLDEIVEGTEAEFVAAKLAERDRRHTRTGDSRYVLEPNVKDGKGGLRDLHTLFWIAKYLYRVERFGDLIERGVLTSREYNRFAQTENFLWRVRGHMHVIAGRAEDRLTFDLQPEIAERMGYGARRGNLAVERFMKHYFLMAKTVGELTRVFCAALEAERLQAAPVRDIGGESGVAGDGFYLVGGRIAVTSDAVFEDRPVRLIKLFRLAQTEGRDIHPKTLRLVHQSLGLITRAVRDDPEANRLLRAILTDRRDPETALRRMNEAGVLGRAVPDFGRVVAQTQHDMYHAYTVDEHTIRAMGVLARIEHGGLADELPLASELVKKIQSRAALCIALFLHDVAKGRGGDHSEIGEGIARRLAPRLGFSPDETETIAWLVRWHLLFSHTAFKRDIGDPKTVTDFVAQVRSRERLRLLLILTAADIRAVGPGRLTAWKSSLLRTLFQRAEEVMTGGDVAEGGEARARAAEESLRGRLNDWTAEEIAGFVRRLDALYWLSADAETQERQARLVKAAEQDGRAIALDLRDHGARGVTEITLFARDRPGLFALAAGAIARAGATIADAKVFTTLDGMALDSFWVQDTQGGALVDDAKRSRLASMIEQALGDGLPLGALPVAPAPPANPALFSVRPQVLVDNDASAKHTVIEVSARDRPGLLHDITRILSACGLTIASAHVSTFGTRAVDVFYVKDRFGFKLVRDTQIALVRAQLLATLAEDAREPALVAARA